MKHVRIEPDGTVTEQWAGREIRNARRGFWKHGKPIWLPYGFRGEIKVVRELPPKEWGTWDIEKYKSK